MILRFIDKTGNHALAFDTDKQVYTTDKDFVAIHGCIIVQKTAIDRMVDEINFNCWHYSKDLSPVAVEEDIPF